MANRLLLINPWITDVAAFDLWAWPLGLLHWAARLRQSGFEVSLIDCLDRAHPALGAEKRASRPFHTGKYRAERFDPQPWPAAQAGRTFRRYGLSPAAFEAELERFERESGSAPDAILVTSRMTYWHHGVADAIARCRRRWPRAPIALGGIYATLCPQHARKHSGADVALEGSAFSALPHWLNALFPREASALEPRLEDPASWPRPALDLCHDHGAAPLLTSTGCPFQCAYCASSRLAPQYRRRSPESVFSELRDYHDQWNTQDFAFYDDALLVDSSRFFEALLDSVLAARLNVRFHTPNGLHYWLIDGALAGKMKEAGVETIRLSLESVRADRLADWSRRAPGREDFLRVVSALRRVGYLSSQIGVYIMAGMPGQTAEEVRETIQTVLDAGAEPKINEYSPIPGTPEWQRALELSGPEIEEEPLWQNNSLYYTRGETGFTREDFAALHRLAKGQ